MAEGRIYLLYKLCIQSKFGMKLLLLLRSESSSPSSVIWVSGGGGASCYTLLVSEHGYTVRT